MTKDHKIRVLVSHLSGKEREKMIEMLLKNPDEITRRLYVRLTMIDRRGKGNA